MGKIKDRFAKNVNYMTSLNITMVLDKWIITHLLNKSLPFMEPYSHYRLHRKPTFGVHFPAC
jgi:hypothetical protein